MCNVVLGNNWISVNYYYCFHSTAFCIGSTCNVLSSPQATYKCRHFPQHVLINTIKMFMANVDLWTWSPLKKQKVLLYARASRANNTSQMLFCVCFWKVKLIKNDCQMQTCEQMELNCQKNHLNLMPSSQILYSALL